MITRRTGFMSLKGHGIVCDCTDLAEPIISHLNYLARNNDASPIFTIGASCVLFNFIIILLLIMNVNTMKKNFTKILDCRSSKSADY